jgi:hypothetical protein
VANETKGRERTGEMGLQSTCVAGWLRGGDWGGSVGEGTGGRVYGYPNRRRFDSSHGARAAVRPVQRACRRRAATAARSWASTPVDLQIDMDGL